MRKTENGLLMLNLFFVVSIVVANVVTAKVVNTGLMLGGAPVLVPGGAITYAFTFLCTDIIGEIWGKKEANKAVWRGFVLQLFALVLILLTKWLPANDPAMQNSYDMLLGQVPIFAFGSLVAYWCSQSWDVWFFHKIRNRWMSKHEGNTSHRWIWNNASTMTSQIIDTVIYISIAFGFGLGWFWQDGGVRLIFNMVVGQYLLKFLLAILDTPFFYFFTRKMKEQ
jgi:hypothetical protein